MENTRPIDKLLDFAKKDERIRVVGMEGSRTNPYVPRDDFQDYDISFVVTDMAAFLENNKWIDFLGERIITQTPEDMELFPPELGNWFSYLMLFTDHSKIDLTLVPIEELELYLESDGLLEIILDKDQRCLNVPEATDVEYHIQKPSARSFDDCCNEFWMVSTYVVKGICRNELLFVNYHFEHILREELLRMLSWRVGFETEFSLSVGKCYKYISQYLHAEEVSQLMGTFELSSKKAIWQALYQAFDLFAKASQQVAARLEVEYPVYEKNIRVYVDEVYQKFLVNNFVDNIIK
ncbi:aminoglycoside 6-adenylyltransferase [Lysinibacillus pakistanensis]|uniref:aminoglycoside 6-adenylyltransferase n=1 Tax=Lysinibacillus pakistanensis TaxID=759811 RepID=UPI003D2A4291